MLGGWGSYKQQVLKKSAAIFSLCFSLLCFLSGSATEGPVLQWLYNVSFVMVDHYKASWVAKGFPQHSVSTTLLNLMLWNWNSGNFLYWLLAPHDCRLQCSMLTRNSDFGLLLGIGCDNGRGESSNYLGLLIGVAIAVPLALGLIVVIISLATARKLPTSSSWIRPTLFPFYECDLMLLTPTSHCQHPTSPSPACSLLWPCQFWEMCLAIQFVTRTGHQVQHTTKGTFFVLIVNT